MNQHYVERFVALFEAHPYMPFDGINLARICPYAWRTRVSDARKRLKAARKGDIANKQVRLESGSKRSLYTFIPSP